MDMCVYTSPAWCGASGEASNRSGFVGTVAAKNLRSDAQLGERLLKLKVSPLSNYQNAAAARRWGASPPMRERRKDACRMHHLARMLQPAAKYLAAARCHLSVSVGAI